VYQVIDFQLNVGFKGRIENGLKMEKLVFYSSE